MKYVSWEDYNPKALYKPLKYRGKKKGEVLERWMALDTETSHNHDEEHPKGWIYQWAFVFGHDCVYGRKPSEFIQALKKIAEVYRLGNGRKLIIYVHNLSYDIQYLKNWLYDAFGDFRILALKEHHFITYENEFFLFKCSYRLSNKSLEKWAKDLGCTNQKKVGLVDYSLIRYQDSPLTNEDWAYMFGDVLTLDECLERQIYQMYNDDITTVPLTSTGYIRRTARQNFQKANHSRRAFLNSRLHNDTYTLCRREFAGGLTHGNRYYSGEIIKPGEGQTIKHRDFRSHYPSQQRVRKFPVGMFNFWGEDIGIDEINRLMNDYALLIECEFSNICVKDKSIVFPILQESQCRLGSIGPVKIIADNGRILSLAGTVNIVCTELDLYWILRMYDIQTIHYRKVYTAVKGYLPEWMLETVDTFFHGKTEFKDLAEHEKDPEKKLDYTLSLMKAKNGLNGLYGCTATDIVRAEITMDAEGESPWNVSYPENRTEALDSYYNNMNSFMRYEWGVYCTNWGRWELLKFAYDIVGNNGTEMWRCLYMDTDSLFYLSDEETERRVEAENARLREKSEQIGAYIEHKGKRVHYDQFTLEDENITAFKFLHAKCYGYETDGKELHITIAGVPARVLDHLDENGKPVYYTREQEMESLDNLEAGFVFRRCGGTTATYTETGITVESIQGHVTEYASAVIIRESTKTLKNEIEKHDDIWEYKAGIIGE